MGLGLSGLSGRVRPGDVVTEEHLRRLIGHGQDPGTGEYLGRRYRTYSSVTEQAWKRADHVSNNLSSEQHDSRGSRVDSGKHRNQAGTPVAGFDLTFSVPKSVSTLWATADAGTQALIARAHHDAVGDIMHLFEREVAMTRVGARGPVGAVAQVEVRGVVAAAFDHYDSRAADPQLHRHVVVANRVQAVQDGKWRTLDSRAVHAAVVGLSEHYNAVLSDHLTRVLGVGWETRSRGPSRSTVWEIAGVRQDLMDEFSTRSRDIEHAVAELVEDFVRAHGHDPSRRVILRLRQQATLETRPAKERRSLAELTASWRERASRLLDQDSTEWAAALVKRSTADSLLRADDVPLTEVHDIAESVVGAVSNRRSTWRHWNLHAEAVRQSMGFRFVTATERETVTARIVDEAQRVSISLTPGELAYTPRALRRGDGESVFRPKASTVFSSERVLEAEERLLTLSRRRSAPTVPVSVVQHAAHNPSRGGRVLLGDQEEAITRIGVSGRVVDVLVGPAGTGKTTAMTALRRAWEIRHGNGSVVGLAPSAAAAEVLAGELRVATENTAKWIFEHDAGRWDLRRGQLVILDEASLAGTLALDRIASHAAEACAKVLLVGDWGQLAAVDAGGAFAMLVADREQPPELLDVRRFRNDWEKHASLNLRLGDTDIVDTYIDHDRVTGGDLEDVLNTAYRAWQNDAVTGEHSVLIADTAEIVAQLNARARHDLIVAGRVDPTGVGLHDGNQAGKGDEVITRRNDRRLRLGRSWVKNGDRWQVLVASDDGSLTVRRFGTRRPGIITLPAAYVAENVELGYAITAHRAQGSTADTGHAIVHSTQMTRESLYVAMTRGRDSNRVYVATDQADIEPHQRHPDDEVTARGILQGILQHTGAEISARQTVEAEQNHWESIAQLLGEYETIAATAQAERWASLLHQGGLDERAIAETTRQDTFGILTAELRRMEADGYNVNDLLPRVIRTANVDDVDDVPTMLRYRLRRLADHYIPSRSRTGARRIAGLFPTAVGTVPEYKRALEERAHLVEQRATQLATAAMARTEPWHTKLPALPADENGRRQWLTAVRTVAAYRDRWGITSSRPLGPSPDNDMQRVDQQRAAAHLRTIAEREDHAEQSRLRRVVPMRDVRDTV